jgi:hypothetical protein
VTPAKASKEGKFLQEDKRQDTFCPIPALLSKEGRSPQKDKDKTFFVSFLHYHPKKEGSSSFVSFLHYHPKKEGSSMARKFPTSIQDYSSI